MWFLGLPLEILLGEQTAKMSFAFFPTWNSRRNKNFDTHEPIAFFIAAVGFEVSAEGTHYTVHAFRHLLAGVVDVDWVPEDTVDRLTHCLVVKCDFTSEALCPTFGQGVTWASWIPIVTLWVVLADQL